MIRPQHGRECVGDRRRPVNARTPDKHLVKHCAERPDVAARSASRPFACSGLMYAAVPSMTPRWIRDGLVIVGLTVAASAGHDIRLHDLGQAEVEQLHRAVRPQLDVGGLEIAMDDALLVRRFEAAAICRAIGTASSSGIGPAQMRSASVGPSTSSRTSARTPSASSTPWMAAMFGWLRAARTCASRWKRAPADRAIAARTARRGSTFSATLASERRVVGPVDLAHAAATDQRDDAEVAGEDVARPPASRPSAAGRHPAADAVRRRPAASAARRRGAQRIVRRTPAPRTRARSARRRSSADSKMARARGNRPGRGVRRGRRSVRASHRRWLTPYSGRQRVSVSCGEGRFVAQIPRGGGDHRLAQPLAAPATSTRATSCSPSSSRICAQLAARLLQRERQDHTLEPNALVNELYLRLLGSQPISYQDRAHFFAIAAQTMRRILIDHARARVADKRGGEQRRVPLSDVEGWQRLRPPASRSARPRYSCCGAWPPRIRARPASSSCDSSAACAKRTSPRSCRCPSSRSSATGRRRAPGSRRGCSSPSANADVGPLIRTTLLSRYSRARSVVQMRTGSVVGLSIAVLVRRSSSRNPRAESPYTVAYASFGPLELGDLHRRRRRQPRADGHRRLDARHEPVVLAGWPLDPVSRRAGTDPRTSIACRLMAHASNG